MQNFHRIALSAIAAASLITTVHADDRNKKIDSTPAQRYSEVSFGGGMNVKTGTSDVRGPYATFRGNAYVPHGSETANGTAPLLFWDAAANFNVFNVDQNSKKLTSDVGISSNLFVGYTINRDDAATMYFGGVGHFDANVGIYSPEKGQVRVHGGPETGVKIEAGPVVMTLGGSVGLGTETCTIATPDGGRLSYNTNAVGFMGIGRLLVGEKFAATVFYVTYPTNQAANSPSGAGPLYQGGTTVNGTLFWKVSDNFQITGNCIAGQYIRTQLGTNDDYRVFQEFRLGVTQKIRSRSERR